MAPQAVEGAPQWAAVARPFTYNYAKAKRMFVEGDADGQWPTTADIAEACDIPFERVRDRCWRDHWMAERVEFQRRLEEERRARLMAELVENRTRIDQLAIDVATRGLTLAADRLAEITTAAADEAHPVRPHPKEVEMISSAATRFHALGERALGIPATHRIEVTGADGAAVQVSSTLDVRGELTADDPDRLAAFLDAAARSGIVEGSVLAVRSGGGGEALGSAPG